MRWEALFADMEAQLAAAHAAELTAQVADLTRAERATVAFHGRLRAAQGRAVAVRVRGGELVDGTLLDLADEWLLVGEGTRRALVPSAAVTAVGGLPHHTQPDGGGVGRRLGLGHALRALARDRAPVRIATDGADVVGRVDAVGADHLDVTALDGGRRDGTHATWVVPFAAVRVVRSG
jgi:hypothetical protein